MIEVSDTKLCSELLVLNWISVKIGVHVHWLCPAEPKTRCWFWTVQVNCIVTYSLFIPY